MSYKEERHQLLEGKLSEKLKDVPTFIADFFVQYKSSATKGTNWTYIRDLLQWLIYNGYINKSSIADITEDDMDKVNSSQVIKYLNELKTGQTGQKNVLSSLCTKKNIFSSFWSYLFLNHYVSDNIIRQIPKHLFKSEDTQVNVKVPTDEQVENFDCNLNNGNNNEFNIIRNITIVKLIMGSGIRSEELINMDIGDLFLDEITPYIMVLGKGKIEKYDKVFISKEAKMHLEEYLVFRNAFVKENNLETDALFLSNDRKRISKSSITSFFKRYSNSEINPHMLRHWVGTKLYNQTKDIVLVQKQLRHASLETAAKYYVHMSEEQIANAMINL